MKSRIAKGAILGTFALLLAIVPALACHFQVNAHSPRCEKLHVNATYFGNSGKYYKIQIFLDGTKVAEQVSKRNVTAVFNGTVAPGSRNIQIKVYEWRYVYWRYQAQTSRTVEVEECYQTCSETVLGDTIYGDWSDWVLDEISQIYTRERTVTDIYVDARDGETECFRRTAIETQERPYELCTLTNTRYGEWSPWEYDPQSGMLKRTRLVMEIDALNPGHICGSGVEEQFDEYPSCEQTEMIVGEWSDWYGHSPNLTRERTITYRDPLSLEVCKEVIQYQQECFPDEAIWVWKLFMPNGSICELRDLGYDGTYDSPGVDQQRAYCGCEVALNAHGYFVDNCQDGFKYWYDLPRYNGCGKCE